MAPTFQRRSKAPTMALPQNVDPGRLRHSVSILQRTEYLTEAQRNNAYGEPHVGWTTVAKRRAEIEAMGGREYWYGAQVVSDSQHGVLMANYPGLTPAMRLMFSGRVFEILNINNPGELGQTTMAAVQVKEAST